MIDQITSARLKSAARVSTHAEILGALRSFFSLLFTGFTQVNLHGFPVEPVAIALSEDETTMKTFELISSQFAHCR
jgi:hypothetical protein